MRGAVEPERVKQKEHRGIVPMALVLIAARETTTIKKKKIPSTFAFTYILSGQSPNNALTEFSILGCG